MNQLCNIYIWKQKSDEFTKGKKKDNYNNNGCYVMKSELVITGSFSCNYKFIIQRSVSHYET